MTHALKRILVIDDDPLICDLLQMMLQDQFVVQTEQDSFTAVYAAQTSPPDLVICDMRMPRLSGSEVIRRLRSNDVTARLPVLLITGEAELGTLPPNQFVGLLRKPFRDGSLREAISALLGRDRTPGDDIRQAA